MWATKCNVTIKVALPRCVFLKHRAKICQDEPQLSMITFCTAYSLEGTKTAAAPGILLSQVSGVTWNPTSSSIFLLTCQIILKTWLVDQLLKASRLHSQCLDAVPRTNFPIRKSPKKGILIVPEERDLFIFFPVRSKIFSPSSVGIQGRRSISISSLAQVPGPAASHLRHLAAYFSATWPWWGWTFRRWTMKSNPCCIVVNPRTPKFHHMSMLSLGSALGTGGQQKSNPEHRGS